MDHDDTIFLSIKKKLKQWERLYEKEHGHKPTKDDIAKSSLKELYQKYNEMRKLTTLTNNNDKVFSESFNKKLPIKRPHPLINNDHSKARKWFKGIGYKTITKVSPNKEDKAPSTSIATTPTSDLIIPKEVSLCTSGSNTGKLASCGGTSAFNELEIPIKDTSQAIANNARSEGGYIVPIHQPLPRKLRLSVDWLDSIKTRIEKEELSSIRNNCTETFDGNRVCDIKSDSCFNWLEESPSTTTAKENFDYFSQYHDENREYPLSEEIEMNFVNEISLINTTPIEKAHSSLKDDSLKTLTASSIVDILEHNEIATSKSYEGEDSNTVPEEEIISDKEEHTLINNEGNLYEEESTADLTKGTEVTSTSVSVTSTYNLSLNKKDRTTVSSTVPSDNSQKKKGAVSDNFVRLNMKVKHFSRKKIRLTGPQYKRQQWKKRNSHQWSGKKRGGGGGGGSECFKCGKSGHWAKNCTTNTDSFLMSESSEPFPSIHEETQEFQMDTSTVDIGTCTNTDKVNESTQKVKSDINEDSDTNTKCSMEFNEELPKRLKVDLYFTDIETNDTEEIITRTLKQFGYSKFKTGQKTAILQVLSGQSTLLVQPTGAGKSLCYQLPTYLYCQRSLCFTLVISPLISLMEDQVKNLPLGLTGASLHVGLSSSERKQILNDLNSGLINVLFVSPETLIAGSSGGNFLMLHQLPPIAFACIDEVHCLSEWSHNFRPSYLRAHKVLKEHLEVECILGLTATATESTVTKVTELLDIKSNNVIIGSSLPDNIEISVSCETNREQALIDLLNSSPFIECNSMIVYCTRQQTTERIAQLIRTSLQYSQERSEQGTEERGQGKKGKGRNGVRIQCQAECYHAGLTPAKRKQVQNNFMKGKLRIVVATVAFGMGLNKADVRGIVHFNMPRSFESFVQEIGRAGRDGKTSYSHVFIDDNGSDLLELRRHVYANGLDYFHVKSLCQKVFLSDKEGDHYKREVALPITQLSHQLDTKEETIATLLCYMEHDGYIKVLNQMNDTITIRCYEGELAAIAKTIPVIDTALKINKGNQALKSNSITFSLTEVANSLQSNSTVVMSQLQKVINNSFNNNTRNLVLETSDTSFHVLLTKHFNDKEKDDMCQELLSKVKHREIHDINRLYDLYSLLKYISQQQTVSVTSNMIRDILSVHFTQGLTSEYFTTHNIPNLRQETTDISQNRSKLCQRDVSSFLSIYDQQQFTGRAIARIFQGIGSPQYPSEIWGQCPYWRKYLDIDFNTLCSIVTQQIVTL